MIGQTSYQADVSGFSHSKKSHSPMAMQRRGFEQLFEV
jgi:hypothetical protein